MESSIVKGTVDAPPSKSMAIRAVAAASLAKGPVVIENPSFCDDGQKAIGIVKAMGAEVVREDGALTIDARPKENRGPVRILDCGESGLCMRMFAPIAALSGEDTILTASGSLSARPMAMVESLRGRGVRCDTALGYPPVSVRGPLKGGSIEIDGSVTSQFLTGLLMALPCCDADSIVYVSDLASAPYVKMTLSLIESFGVLVEHDRPFTTFFIKGNQKYGAGTYRVEGDWSAGAFLLVAGAIAGSVLVEGLFRDSLQADKAIIEPLADAGAMVAIGKDCVYAQRGDLKAFTFDASGCPDLFPPLVALASCCEGKSVIHGAARLAHKESNRARVLASEFGKMGIAVTVDGDVMTVEGGALTGARVESHGDHRIAMASAVAALRADGPVIIGNPEVVSKSYPAFFDDLKSLKVAL